ncbi:hypothetical protein TNCV_2397981 [Trichonephila clavipes]|uniref:Uncharacterized protein n=1 Tax=Trichonephila clavipes TaxID=2585209 RepID=A0A8X6T4Q1_TRICX|nr:hypothetical protein TNCV_2397981 [Trichonephila clavipes]
MSQDYCNKLYGDVGDVKRVQICIATRGWKRLHSVLSSVVHKSIGGNRPALPQSFELSSTPEQYETFYEHRSGRYALDLWFGRRK